MFISSKLLVLATILIISSLPLWVTRHAANAESAGDQADENDCADQMQQMVSCIPYVSGTANKPTPQCCADAEKVRSTKPKCLCLLIRESTDPSLDLPINTTLALHMPAACNSEAKVSNCPSMLLFLFLSLFLSFNFCNSVENHKLKSELPSFLCIGCT
jgi:Probable lipid transfer